MEEHVRPVDDHLRECNTTTEAYANETFPTSVGERERHEHVLCNCVAGECAPRLRSLNNSSQARVTILQNSAVSTVLLRDRRAMHERGLFHRASRYSSEQKYLVRALLGPTLFPLSTCQQTTQTTRVFLAFKFFCAYLAERRHNQIYTYSRMRGRQTRLFRPEAALSVCI